MQVRLVMIVSAALLALVGCSKGTDAQGFAVDIDKVDYLVRSEGRMLTAPVADRLLAVQMAMARGGRARARQFIESIDAKFKLDVVVGEYAELKSLKVDEKEVSRYQQLLLRRCPEFNKDNLRTLQRLIREELQVREVRKAFAASCNVRIPETEVQRRAMLLTRINESGASSNLCQYAKATNCWDRIRLGKASFEDACREFDETKNPSEGGEWGEFALNAFGEEEETLKSYLRTMKVGEVTPPIEGDNGLVIVKLLGTGVTPENAGVDVPAKTYRLARIFFHLYEIFPVPPADELREELRGIELSKRWRAYAEHLLSKTKFTYGRDGQALKEWKERKLKEVAK